MLWYLCNDLGGPSPWGSPASGIEEQTTIWGYNRTDALAHAIFKRFRLIYKGNASTPTTATIDSMYMAQWSDPDLGIFGDDFAGCDTILSLGYVYNGDSIDADYEQYGLAPPSLGYDVLQGPLSQQEIQPILHYSTFGKFLVRETFPCRHSSIVLL